MDEDDSEADAKNDGARRPRWSKKGTIIQIKGFDNKSTPKPDRFNCKPEDYEEWKELFVASMMAMDSIWEPILAAPAMTSSKNLKRDDIAEFLEGIKVDKSIHRQVSKMLYVNLL